MTASIACRASQPRRSLSYKATTLIAVITAMTFAASGAAPTMLYQRYHALHLDDHLRCLCAQPSQRFATDRAHCRY